MNLGRLFLLATLFLLLVVSIGAVGYVIFFRVVVAAELPPTQPPIVFEEPGMPHHAASTHGGQTTGPDEQPHRVAIIIDDMGYHNETGKRLLALDADISFSFLPNAPYTAELEEEAYKRGRTVMLHLPLEPRRLEWDPGPGALYLAQGRDEHARILDADLLLVPHASGVNNHMGSRYTESTPAMTELADMLAERQLFFIDSVTTAQTVGEATARKRGVPASRRSIFLDNDQNVEAICRQLGKLAESARRRDGVIGIGHPHPETLQALKTCGATILTGINLVGADQLVH